MTVDSDREEAVMEEGKGYNGWANYETWSVALILDNDQDLQWNALDVVRIAVQEGEPSEYWTEDERKRYRSADALKDWVERAAEIENTITDSQPWSYLWSQLVSAALSEVDWHEVADHYLQSLDEVTT